MTAILLLGSCWLLPGCGNPEQRGVVRYLQKVDRYQQQVPELQRELKSFKLLAITERGQKLDEWLAKVHKASEELKALEQPPAAKNYHVHLVNLYVCLEAFGQESKGTPDPNVLQKITKVWADELKGCETELTRLGG